MMVKWANDLLQANDGKMIANDGEMLVNDGEMSTLILSLVLLVVIFLSNIKSLSSRNDLFPAFEGLVR